MILAALILQAAAPQSAVDAERAFNAAAQAKGQWTAFRETAAPDAVMFQPGPVKALDWMKGKADPPKAVEWWPTESYVSCDGRLAVNTGGWRRPNGTVGYFTTVWERQPDGGWKWSLDHGDALAAPRSVPMRLAPQEASCAMPTRGDPREPVPIHPTGNQGGGASPDHTLIWEWLVDDAGGRRFAAYIWTGTSFTRVIEDKVAPAP